MSSIYRKGRDGYYYYQAYLLNPESNKKDKKVFHSLGTKNQLIAEKKQKMFDLKYDNNNSASGFYWLSYKFNLGQTFIIILGTFTITFMIANRGKGIVDVQPNVPNSIISPLNENHKKDISKKKSSLTDNYILAERIKKKDVVNPIIKENITNKKNNSLKHIIERIDRPYGASELGKIYVTIESTLSKKNQMLICKKILDQYPKFSNIIICLYTNTNAGIALARGNDEMVSIQDQKESWLGMYTFNPVEGEYFDDNPSGYLGIQ